MMCRCRSTSHDLDCWKHPAGRYLNGVKVAQLPAPSIVVLPASTLSGTNLSASESP